MKVTDKIRAQADKVTFICDFTPPRAADPVYLPPAKAIGADFICVAYNPGRRVRVDSAMFAYALKRQTGQDVIFNLAPRDMNKLALQTHLLGVQLLGLENVVVIYGDTFTEKDLTQVAKVRDYKPTELIRAIKAMNEGVDYKNGKLKRPTNFCIGATIDFGRGIKKEAGLTHRKTKAGADYFITQPVFETDEIKDFGEAYAAVAGSKLKKPVFYGVQILEKEGVIFSNVPEKIRRELAQGREGTDIALEMLSELLAMGIKTIYLVPPILRGGARNYEAAQRVLASL